jgi:hypothetical protein
LGKKFNLNYFSEKNHEKNTVKKLPLKNFMVKKTQTKTVEKNTHSALTNRSSSDHAFFLVMKSLHSVINLKCDTPTSYSFDYYDGKLLKKEIVKKAKI